MGQDGGYEEGQEEYDDDDDDGGGGNASLRTSIFNLVSTIVGGGVLSLPYSMQLLGVVGGGICLLLSGLASEYSVYLLVACTSKSGMSTYADIAEGAFGNTGAVFCTILILSLTFLCCVAYLVLTADLISPLLLAYVPFDWRTINSRILVQLVFLVAVFPLCVLRSMSSLRFTSFFSIISVGALAIVIAMRSIDHNMSNSPVPSEPRNHSLGPASPEFKIKYFPTSFEDAAYGIPIFSVAFLCHFNVLPLKGELIRPTRRRLQHVIRSTVYICGFLYVIVAYSGYLEFGPRTCGNILLNFDAGDVVVTVGRIGLACTLLCSFPLLVQPCRSALYDLIGYFPDLCSSESGRDAAERQRLVPGQEKFLANDRHSLRSPLGQFVVDSPNLGGPPRYDGVNDVEAPHLSEDPLPTERIITRERADSGSDGWGEVLCRVLVTVCLLAAAFKVATSVVGIMQIWSVMGSTVGTLIAFIIPSAAYIRLRHARPWRGEKLAASLFLLCAVVLCVVCTWLGGT